MRVFAEKLAHQLDHFGHARHAAHQNHLVDLTRIKPRIFQRLLARLHRALNQVFHQRFQFRAGELHIQVFGPVLIRRDEGQINICLLGGGKLNLRFLRRFFQALQGELVFTQVNALLFFEFIREVIEDAHIEIFPAKERIAIGGLDFKHPVADLQHRHVKRTAAKVIYGDGLAVFFLKTIGECGGSRLVDNPQHIEAGNLPGIFRCLALGVVKIGGHGDHRVRHFFA